MHPCIIEEILHFTCGQCSNWWSVGTTETYRPEELHCPQCGEKRGVEYNEIQTPKPNFVKDTGTAKGRGVFAGQEYKQDDLVECSPVIVFIPDNSNIPFVVGCITFDWVASGHPACAIALGYGTLFNHANPANLSYQSNLATREIYFYAARDIAQGEELTINYNSDGQSEWPDNNWFKARNIKPI